MNIARALKINDDEDGFYVFEDIASMFWPDDDGWNVTVGGDNHEAADRIKAELIKRGCTTTPGRYTVVYNTPHGTVIFDPESGCCEFHSTSRPAVEYVVGVVEAMLAERARHREALS